MKYYGDIPERHLEVLEELEALESWFGVFGKELSTIAAAKGFVCMAHDYYEIEFDEEGDRLIMLAEEQSPGYFKGPIHSHMSNDLAFDYLVNGLKKSLGFELMKSLGFTDEKTV